MYGEWYCPYLLYQYHGHNVFSGSNYPTVAVSKFKILLTFHYRQDVRGLLPEKYGIETAISFAIAVTGRLGFSSCSLLRRTGDDVNMPPFVRNSAAFVESMLLGWNAWATTDGPKEPWPGVASPFNLSDSCKRGSKEWWRGVPAPLNVWASLSAWTAGGGLRRSRMGWLLLCLLLWEPDRRFCELALSASSRCCAVGTSGDVERWRDGVRGENKTGCAQRPGVEGWEGVSVERECDRLILLLL